MANHKRRRAPNQRSGCKMCKPYKGVTGYKGKADSEVAGAGGFGKIRRLRAAERDMRDEI